jgi:hypothetical protein
MTRSIHHQEVKSSVSHCTACSAKKAEDCLCGIPIATRIESCIDHLQYLSEHKGVTANKDLPFTPSRITTTMQGAYFSKMFHRSMPRRSHAVSSASTKRVNQSKEQSETLTRSVATSASTAPQQACMPAKRSILDNDEFTSLWFT